MEPISILLITITVLLALLTIGVWGILFALVKSQSGANAERAAAVRGISEKAAGQAAVFPIDKFLSETKPGEGSVDKLEEKLREKLRDLPNDLRPSEAVVQDLRRSRTEEMPVAPGPQDKAEPPAIDLRTGIITVAQEEAFDFEKEITTNRDRAIQAEYGHGALPPFGPPGTRSVDVEAPPPFGDVEAPDTKVIQTDKTMRWDKEELSGFASRPDSIVVEGGEPVKAQASAPGAKKPDGMQAVPEPEAKHEDVMISGEDIENTLDSFFGLGDK